MTSHSNRAILRLNYHVQGKDFNHGGEVSTDIKARLKEIGFDTKLVRRVAIASFEAEMNVVLHAEKAKVTFEAASDKIRVIFDDEGRGIPDIDLAMQAGYSTATPEMRKMGYGAGIGLPTIKREADELKIESSVDRGTRVKMDFYP